MLKNFNIESTLKLEKGVLGKTVVVIPVTSDREYLQQGGKVAWELSTDIFSGFVTEVYDTELIISYAREVTEDDCEGDTGQYRYHGTNYNVGERSIFEFMIESEDIYHEVNIAKYPQKPHLYSVLEFDVARNFKARALNLIEKGNHEVVLDIYRQLTGDLIEGVL